MLIQALVYYLYVFIVYKTYDESKIVPSSKCGGTKKCLNNIKKVVFTSFVRGSS